MVDIERLKARGLRAYELGRLRSAAQIALYLAPAAALCFLLARDKEHCSCLIAVLLAAAIGLRWRSRSGSESVTTGLIAGSLPLAVGLLLATDPSCNRPLCIAISAVAATAAGIWVGFRQRDPAKRRTGPLVACAIAILAASVGCLPLGVFGVLGVVAGMLVGSGVGSVASSRLGLDP
jgi:hypothetical protein